MAKSKKRGRKSGASLQNLKTGTHRGRKMATPPSNGRQFISRNGAAKLTAPVMMGGMSPTPHGPEPRY